MRSVQFSILSGSLAICAFACSSSTPNGEAVTCASGYDALVAASNYMSSQVGGCNLAGNAALPFAGADLGTDPALAYSGGRAFFIARQSPAGSVIFELDPHCAKPLATYSAEDPSSVGYSDAQDVAVTASGALWIPRFNVPTLLVLDSTGNRVGTIDLSSQDPDGNPNMSAIRIAQIGGAEKAFVALERLDDHAQFASILPSFMIRIDVATRAVEAQVVLEGRDPFGVIAENDGAFFLAAPGSFSLVDEKDAGIERFDPTSFTSTYLLGEADLGGSATEVAVNGSCGVAIVADPTTANATSLITFDADQGTTLTTAKNPVLATAGFDLSGLAWKGDALLIGERAPASNGAYPIHVFDLSGVCNLKERPDSIFLSQAPVVIRAVP